MSIQRFIEGIQVIIDRKNEQIRERNAEILRLRGAINGLYSSLSWKITGPLRFFHSFLTGKKSSPANFQGNDDLTAHPTDDRIVIPRELIASAPVSQPKQNVEAKAPVTANMGVKQDADIIVQIHRSLNVKACSIF